VHDIPDKEFKEMKIRMIKKFKEDTNKHQNAINDDTNKI
jgi:hypothetical protein